MLIFSQQATDLCYSFLTTFLGKFTHDELESLEKEFKDHEKHIEDYRNLADKIVDNDAISENDIRSLDRLSSSEIKQLQKSMKVKHHNISSQFLSLQKKVVTIVVKYHTLHLGLIHFSLLSCFVEFLHICSQ